MTSTTETSPQIIKTDTLGRLRMTTERRKSLLDEFERSGLSGAKFAALMGVKYSTFASWRQQRQRRHGGQPPVTAKPNDTVHWLEAVVEQAHSPGGSGQPVVLQLPGGVRVEIATAAQVELAAALVRSLGKAC